MSQHHPPPHQVIDEKEGWREAKRRVLIHQRDNHQIRIRIHETSASNVHITIIYYYPKYINVLVCV